MREARKKEKLYFIAISARFYELHFHAIFFVISCVPENENPSGIYFSRVFNKIVSFNRFFVRFSHAHVLSPLLFALLLWLLNFDSFFARVPRWKLLLCIIVRLRFSRRCQLPRSPLPPRVAGNWQIIKGRKIFSQLCGAHLSECVEKRENQPLTLIRFLHFDNILNSFSYVASCPWHLIFSFRLRPRALDCREASGDMKAGGTQKPC